MKSLKKQNLDGRCKFFSDLRSEITIFIAGHLRSRIAQVEEHDVEHGKALLTPE